MSIVALGTSPDGLIFAADGACSDYGTGEVLGFASKLVLMPERNCILATTGLGRLGALIQLEASQQFPTFDEFAAALPYIAREAFNELAATGMFGQDPHALRSSIVIGGWSEEAGCCQAYRVASYAKQSVDPVSGALRYAEPWQLEEISGFYASRIPSPAAMEEFDLNNEERTFTDLAARFVCAARVSCAEEPAGAEKQTAVGGFLQMAYLERDRIDSWIAHRWQEDVVGRPIDARRGERLPACLHATV